MNGTICAIAHCYQVRDILQPLGILARADKLYPHIVADDVVELTGLSGPDLRRAELALRTAGLTVWIDFPEDLTCLHFPDDCLHRLLEPAKAH